MPSPVTVFSKVSAVNSTVLMMAFRREKSRTYVQRYAAGQHSIDMPGLRAAGMIGAWSIDGRFFPAWPGSVP
jgi:hypothetical protein